MDKKVYEPGIYTISNAHYHASAGISRSGIMEFKRSPKHFWHRYVNENYIPKKSTPAMKFGTTFHSYILENEKFDDQYVLKPKTRDKMPEKLLLKDVGKELYTASKKAYETEQKRRKQEDIDFYHFSMGKEVIEHEDFETIKKMKHELYQDPQARELIQGAQYEKSIYWIDPTTQLLCKCRPDILHNSFVVDLKTAENASPKIFQNELFKKGYYIQMGMIMEGLKHALNKEVNTFIDLAIETEEPYCHAIYPIDEAAVQQGIEEFKSYLIKMKEFFDKNEWPSYQVQTISLPAYAKFEE